LESDFLVDYASLINPTNDPDTNWLGFQEIRRRRATDWRFKRENHHEGSEEHEEQAQAIPRIFSS